MFKSSINKYIISKNLSYVYKNINSIFIIFVNYIVTKQLQKIYIDDIEYKTT